MTKIISATGLRERMEEVLTAAGADPEPSYITYRSQAAAVLLGYEHFEALMEQLEDLSDIVAVYERRGEPRRPFGEYLAEEDPMGVRSVSAEAS